MTDPEQAVVRLRLGLDGDGPDPQTLVDVRQVFGLTRHQVCEIEARFISLLPPLFDTLPE